ncbi:MAG: hypothetical protein WCX46_04365 [Candidatus Paceibacterota bacterium]
MITKEQIKKEAKSRSHEEMWYNGFCEGGEFVRLQIEEMIKALKATNQYFINLQNKCALTSNDERAWKKISLILSKIK